MLLKRLELQGLKSFADKTILDLSSNITAIVGPNGSGKSNITDGVRWILGERDARNLRGTKGEDLIFSGTEKRSRLGLAQATLYFDNESGFFPVDFKEVSVSRKISRDGVSQFFINKSEVRLKDIIDFLARIKLGARGLTVINQGESDVFIKSNPQERKEMIEEILGLKEYQLKKNEASRKLQNTFFNLEKAKALVEEIKPHLRLLRRQASRYENRERIASELKELESVFYGGRVKRLNNELEKLSVIEKEIDARIKSAKLEFEKIESELKGVSRNEPKTISHIKEIRVKRQNILERRAEFQRTMGKLEAQLEMQARKTVKSNINIEDILHRIKMIAEEGIENSDVNKLHDILQKILSVIEDLFQGGNNPDKSEEAKISYEKVLGDIKSMDDELNRLNTDEVGLQKSLESFNKDFKDAYEHVESERAKVEVLVKKKNEILLEKERIVIKLSSLEEEVSQMGRKLSSLEKSFDELGDDKNTIEESDEGVAMKRIYKLREEISRIGEIDASIITEAKETEERYVFLDTQIGDLEKAITDLKLLIKELDDKISMEFNSAIKSINEEFSKLVREMFGGGKGRLMVKSLGKKIDDEYEEEANHVDAVGIEIDISLPKKRIKGLEALSGGERSLISVAALFALISVSPPPFLVLDEVDAALDEKNAKRLDRKSVV